ncbi:MAG: hypothetical protein CMK45_03485, partial [Porticoccus sp.]|nr:hypothetical protein [Porticoccus sp.]
MSTENESKLNHLLSTQPLGVVLSSAWLAKQGPKIWKWANKPGNNPIDLYKKYLKSVKTRAQAGDMKSLAPEMG